MLTGKVHSIKHLEDVVKVLKLVSEEKRYQVQEAEFVQYPSWIPFELHNNVCWRVTVALNPWRRWYDPGNPERLQVKNRQLVQWRSEEDEVRKQGIWSGLQRKRT